MTYTEPRKIKGFWITEVREGDKVVMTVTRTTKKGLLDWIKEHKQTNK